MTENVVTLNKIRAQVLDCQNSMKMKLAFPALYLELVIFMAYLILSHRTSSNTEIQVTSFVFILALALIISLAYYQMKRLNSKLTQVRYLIFSSTEIFEKEFWDEKERASAIEYVKDSSAFVQINCLAYVFAMLNLLILTVLIASCIH